MEHPILPVGGTKISGQNANATKRRKASGYLAPCSPRTETSIFFFHGRFLWDAWNLVKGLSNDEAKAKFVREFFSFPASSLYKDTRENLLSAGPGGVQAAY